MIGFSPGHIRNVKEPFHSSQIYECSKICQAFHLTLDFLSLAELAENPDSSFFPFILEEKFSGKNSIFGFALKLYNLKFIFISYKLFRLFDCSYVGMGVRKESIDSNINSVSIFYFFNYFPRYPRLVVVSSLQVV